MEMLNFIFGLPGFFIGPVRRLGGRFPPTGGPGFPLQSFFEEKSLKKRIFTSIPNAN